jgi:hypothetical protein
LPESQVKSNSPSFSVSELRFNGLKNTPILIAGTVLILTFAGVLFLLESNKASSEIELYALQSQISALKNELALAQSDWLSDQEDLYGALDEMEVSIHSIQEKPLVSAPQSKVITTPNEAELRRWRFLGLSRMGVVEQAFFHTGKNIIMVPKDGVALGEWRLTQAQKDAAILTHVNGKLITLKPAKSE